MEHNPTNPSPSSTAAASPSPGTWESVVKHLDSWRGRPNTDLVRRNTATCFAGLVWALLTIIFLPYQKEEILPAPASLQLADTSIWFSPLSQWPVNVVEKGLGFSSEMSEVLHIWGDRPDLGAKLQTGEIAVKKLLAQLSASSRKQSTRYAQLIKLPAAGVSKAKPARHDFADFDSIYVEYQNRSLAASIQMGKYTDALRTLAHQIANRSMEVESELTNILSDTRGSNWAILISASVETRLRDAFRPIYMGLPPLLEILLGEATVLQEPVFKLEQILTVLANPETEILHQGNQYELGFSGPRYRTRLLGPSSEKLGGEKKLRKAVKKPADILAGYYKETVLLRGVVLEMKTRIMHMRTGQYIFGKWMMENKLLLIPTEEQDAIAGYEELLYVNRAGLEQEVEALEKGSSV